MGADCSVDDVAVELSERFLFLYPWMALRPIQQVSITDSVDSLSCNVSLDPFPTQTPIIHRIRRSRTSSQSDVELEETIVFF